MSDKTTALVFHDWRHYRPGDLRGVLALGKRHLATLHPTPKYRRQSSYRAVCRLALT